MARKEGAVATTSVGRSIGRIPYDRGEWNQAIESYTHALALRPELAQAYTGRGLAYYRLGDLKRAIADYDQALSLQPAAARVYNSRGVAYYERGDLNQAIADY